MKNTVFQVEKICILMRFIVFFRTFRLKKEKIRKKKDKYISTVQLL